VRAVSRIVRLKATMPKKKNNKRRFTVSELIWKSAVSVAVISGLFSLTVSVLLVANYLQVTAISPLDNPQLLALRQQLAAAPDADEKLVAQVRLMDLLARKAFFTSQAHLKMGGYLLLGGVIVLVMAIRTAMKYNPRLPNPEGPPAGESYWLSRTHAKEIVAFVGMVWVIVALLAAYLTPLDLPPPGDVPSAPAAESAISYPDWETMQKNWPSFRGPGGYGVAFYTTAPTEWDVESGKNIKWKTDIPLPGANSPVVWDKRIFLSGATAEKREVYCFDTETGQLQWSHALDKMPGTPDTPPDVGEETGFAASTLAVQGDRVMALFANGDLVCYDAAGTLKWGKNLGVPDNHYGHSSSLIAYQNLLFVQYDQRKNGKLFALDIADGKEAWVVNREKISWASPACVPTKFGMELVLNSEKNVDAYDPLKGTLVWQLKCLDGEVAPSPAYGGGMFFVANDNATSTAIKFNADEKTPKPEIAWQWDQSLPDVSSPVCADKFFFMATSRGEIICLNSADGSEGWVQEFDDGFYVSPILVGDLIYVVDKKGTAFVFKAGVPYTQMAKASLGDEVLATPAFLDGRIYVRTVKNLMCISN